MIVITKQLCNQVMIVMKHCSSEQLLLNSKNITITYHHIRTNACSKTDGAIF